MNRKLIKHYMSKNFFIPSVILMGIGLSFLVGCGTDYDTTTQIDPYIQNYIAQSAKFESGYAAYFDFSDGMEYAYKDEQGKRRQKWETYSTLAAATRRKHELDYIKDEYSFELRK